MRKTRDRARAREIPRPGLSRSTRRLINTILFCNRTSASAGSPVLLECSLLASVAQGIEHRSPKAGVDGSNPPGGTSEHDGVARAAPFLVCEPNRRIRAVETRATFSRGCRFRIRPGAPVSTTASHKRRRFWFRASLGTGPELSSAAPAPPFSRGHRFRLQRSGFILRPLPHGLQAV